MARLRGCDVFGVATARRAVGGRSELCGADQVYGFRAECLGKALHHDDGEILFSPFDNAHVVAIAVDPFSQLPLG